MKIRKSVIPHTSLIRDYCPADYHDTFECTADSATAASADDVMVGFWTDFPGWVNALFKIRNFLVKFVGLEGAENSLQDFENCIRKGGKCGIASFAAKNDKETVLLLEDKHLDAYLSILIEKNKVYAITLVHFKNRLGRIYFFFVRPFHGLITRSLLKRTLKRKAKQ